MKDGPADAAPPKLRLFVALWPDAATRDAIASWQRTWTWPERAAQVPPERFHLTLHFLGDVPAQKLPTLVDVLRVPCENFSLALEVPEVWPNGAAVLRPESVPDALLRLHAALGPRLAGFGLPLDTRPYRPHVTLARRATGGRPQQPLRVQWQIEQGYVLAQSLPGGAGYHVIERFA